MITQVMIEVLKDIVGMLALLQFHGNQPGLLVSYNFQSDFASITFLTHSFLADNASFKN